MTQQEGARALADFYEYVPSRVQIGEFIPKLRTRWGLILPTFAWRKDLLARRDALLPRSFRFTWPDLPKGARYLPEAGELCEAPTPAGRNESGRKQEREGM